MNTEVHISAKKEGFFRRIAEGIAQIPREHKGFGKQILMLAKNDMIKTYQGAVIGPFGAVMHPLIQLFVDWMALTIG
ncbi:MAG: hypothetical protein VZR73_05310, partial [Acutalibacteraceae bacterium]|nr:hypothetical protein [Acutalibacteraceae bacterium]